MRAQLFEKETTVLGNEETLSDPKQRVGSDSDQGVLLLVERRQACRLLMLVVFRTRDALFTIEGVKVSYFPLFTVFPTLSLVDSRSF